MALHEIVQPCPTLPAYTPCIIIINITHFCIIGFPTSITYKLPSIHILIRTMIAFIRYVSFHLHYVYVMLSKCLKGIPESKNFCLVRLEHLIGSIRYTIQFLHRTTFGIVGLIIMSYLRRSRRAVTVPILICKVIRLSSCR